MNTVIKGFKYRIYPNKEQELKLNKTFGCVRFVYNQILAKKIDLYKSEGKSINKTTCNNYCNRELKKEYLWLKEVDKFALTNSIYNLDNAYQNFFREIKQGNKNQGFPKFKSKKNHYYSYTTNFTNNNIKVDYENNKIQLPKLKWIKAKLHREFKGKILFATISKTPSGKYFVSFNVECEHQELKQNSNNIAMDLGIKDLLITSNGIKIDNKKLTYKYEQKLAKLQRQIAKKKIGSQNWKKQRIKIARLHEKITNTRKDNLHKISHQIVKENQLIFSENLNIKGMVKNHNLAKSIHDCGWYELTRQLTYKSEWNDRIYHKVDRFYPSSQLCNICGYKNEDTKNLGVRFWICPQCNTKHDRDENASINILNQGLKELELEKVS
ncbi:TPA: transposase [Clostridium botulinum]|nr:transposase [Clostridium botulinum]